MTYPKRAIVVCTLFLSGILLLAGCDKKTGKKVEPCGNGVLDSGEACDGDLLNGQDCQQLGFSGGILSCRTDCSGFDTSLCETGPFCGDGELQAGEGEQCDGDDLGGAACEDFGYYGGELSCSGDCTFELAGCSGLCGDGVLQTDEGEQCDGNDLGGVACGDLGLYPGTLACDECQLDTSGCGGYCGDHQIQAQHQEECDGPGAGGGTCRTWDLFFGTPVCETDCTLSPGDCAMARLWGTSANEYVNGMTIDHHGNLLVTGKTLGSLFGDPHAGGEDAFLLKILANGQVAWTRQWGTAANDSANGVAVDSAGNIFVAGQTDGAIDGQTHAGQTDAFLTSFSPDGEHRWTRQWGTSANDPGMAVKVDTGGSIFVTGYTLGAMDGQSHLGGSDIFLKRFNADGTSVWTRQWGTNANDSGSSLAIHDNHVFVAGITRGALGGQTYAGLVDVFVMKVDFSGDVAWTRLIGTPGNDYSGGVVVDETGNVYLGGSTGQALPDQVSAGNQDPFLVRYDNNGNRIWIRQWGTATEDNAGALAFASGKLFLAGTTRASMDEQPWVASTDIFLTAFTVNGEKLWTRMWGTGSYESGSALAADSSGGVFVGGHTGGTLFGLSPSGQADVFVLFTPAN